MKVCDGKHSTVFDGFVMEAETNPKAHTRRNGYANGCLAEFDTLI
jgi:hypothetical protein